MSILRAKTIKKKILDHYVFPFEAIGKEIHFSTTKVVAMFLHVVAKN